MKADGDVLVHASAGSSWKQQQAGDFDAQNCSKVCSWSLFQGRVCAALCYESENNATAHKFVTRSCMLHRRDWRRASRRQR